MKFVDQSHPIKRQELQTMAENFFGNLVKAVVDIDLETMIVDAELHADEEARLLELGSSQQNLWGINLHPDSTDDDWVEFDSMINLRPSQGNVTRGVDNVEIQSKIRSILKDLIQ